MRQRDRRKPKSTARPPSAVSSPKDVRPEPDWPQVVANMSPVIAAAIVMALVCVLLFHGYEIFNFTLSIDEEYEYRCGEYVGDERKGIVTAGGTADVEMTFHFDHIFGDAGTPPDDDLNQDAVGFQPFADIADGTVLDADLAELESRLSPSDYAMLVDILPTLGHVGEGHCHCECG